MQWRRLVPALGLAGACGLLAAPSVSATAAQAGSARPPRGYTLVGSSTLVAPAGEQTRGVVACPPGLVPLSGSAGIHSTSVLASVNSSFPLGNNWIADVNNASATDVTFEVDAVCARQPKSYAVVVGPLVQNPSGSQVRAAADCPQGSKPLGGGVASSSFSIFANINTTIPSLRSWVVFVNNASADDADLSARVVCGKLPGYTVSFGSVVANPAGSHTPSFATCPAPTVPIGGGGGSSSTSVAVNIGGMGTAGSDFLSSENNASGVDFVSSTVAICAGK
jgi:hypothetical protein